MDGEQDLWEGEYTYRCILTNDYTSTNREIVEFYNLRGGKERIFDAIKALYKEELVKPFEAERTIKKRDNLYVTENYSPLFFIFRPIA